MFPERFWDRAITSGNRKGLTRLVIFEKNVVGLSESALSRFLLRAKRSARLRGTVNVFITNSATMRSLNARFRGKNKPTDVLSFPAGHSSGRRSDKFSGELAICAEIAATNAKRLGHTTALEIKVLVLHGILHLAGFDHERDNGQMARKEEKLRRNLGLPSSLTERDLSERDVRLSSGGRAPLKRARRPA